MSGVIRCASTPVDDTAWAPVPALAPAPPWAVDPDPPVAPDPDLDPDPALAAGGSTRTWISAVPASSHWPSL
jgi:hypothetical protein